MPPISPTWPVLLELALIAAVLAAALSIGYWTWRTGISPMPTLPAARRTLLAALPPPAAIAGTVYELGAGWGTLALPLARRYPAARVVALELSPLPWAVCRLRARLAGVRNLVVRRADFLRVLPRGVTLGDAALLVCYLDPGNMARLRPKLEAELTDGAVVVSSTFAVPGWQPAAMHTAPHLHRTPVYVYRWPQVARLRA
jgi:predicted O-methyltransferase YrrM